MEKKIRFTIKDDGEIHMKTLGMADESCFDYLALMESILEAETIDSEYTDEFLQEQASVKEEATVTEQRVNRND